MITVPRLAILRVFRTPGGCNGAFVLTPVIHQCANCKSVPFGGILTHWSVAKIQDLVRDCGKDCHKRLHFAVGAN